jgi:hypothetical protein
MTYQAIAIGRHGEGETIGQFAHDAQVHIGQRAARQKMIVVETRVEQVPRRGGKQGLELVQLVTSLSKQYNAVKSHINHIRTSWDKTTNTSQ